MKNLTTPLLLLLISLAGSLHAQTATYTYVNQIKPYTNPKTPMLTAKSNPKIGTTLTVEVPLSWRQRNGVGADYVLATGFKNPTVRFDSLGGWLFTSADVFVFTKQSPLGTPGTTTIDFAIPNLKTLVGYRFYQQVLEVSTQTGAKLSRGGVGLIGT